VGKPVVNRNHIKKYRQLAAVFHQEFSTVSDPVGHRGKGK
jgi:hypothetical protein